jgi:hypothetical protein
MIQKLKKAFLEPEYIAFVAVIVALVYFVSPMKNKQNAAVIFFVGLSVNGVCYLVASDLVSEEES